MSYSYQPSIEAIHDNKFTLEGFHPVNLNLCQCKYSSQLKNNLKKKKKPIKYFEIINDT